MIVEIEFRGIDLFVEGDYQPEEPEVRYYPDGSGYPGCGEEYTINTIYIENTDITSLLEEHMEEIEKLVLEKLEENNNY